MNYIELKKLTLDNFGTYKHQEFDFEYLFDGSNCLFVTGKNEDDSFENDNGSGKSMIYESLLFLVTGKTARKSKTNNLIGEFAKSMNVEGVFHNKNTSDTIKAIRYRKDKIHGNQVLIWINDKPVKAKSTPTEQSKYLERLLNTSYDGLLNTNIIEENDKKTRFIYMGDKDAKELIGNFGGLNVFSVCHSLVTDYEKKYSNKLNNILKIKLSSTENSITSKTEDIANTKKIIKKTTQKMNDTIDEEKKSMEKHNAKINNKIEELKQKLMHIDKKEKVLNKELKEKESLYKSCLNESEELASEILTVIGDLSQVGYKIKALNKEKESISEGICTECRQVISKEHVKNQHKKINKQINKLEPKLEFLSNKRKKLGKKEIEVSKSLRKAEKDHIACEANIGLLQSEKKHTREQRRDLWSQLEDNTKIDSLQQTLKYNLDMYKQQLSDYTESLKKLQKKKKSLETKIKKTTKLLKYIVAWKKGFSREEIQAASMKSIINEFNNRMKEIAEAVTDGRLDINIRTNKKLGSGKDKSVFLVDIKRKTNHGSKQLPINEWSKGQKKRIEIISSLSFDAISPSALDIFFLDELFNGVDMAGISRIVNFLKAESNSNKKFVIFSHSKEIMKLFSNRGVVTLNNGCSTFSHRRIS